MKEIAAEQKDVFWKEDRKGFFTIKPFPKEQCIKVRYYKNHKLTYLFTGKTPQQLYHKITSMGLVSRHEHAAYLGKELEKAYLAMKYGIDYVQDKPLDLRKKGATQKEKKVISLAPSNTEILYALGVGKNIIADTRFCDYPADARKKTKIGGWLDIDYMQVKRLNADLVLSSSFVQHKVVEQCRKLNINIVHLDPRTLNDVYKSIAVIGELTGRQQRARELVQMMQQGFEQAKKRLMPGKMPRLYIEEWHKPPTAAGNWVPELAKMAGALYRLHRPGQKSNEITASSIRRYNPEIIILSICGMGNKVNPDIIRSREGWQQIDAVKNNRIYAIDDSLLNRPGPRLVQGLQYIIDKVKKYRQINK